MKIYQIVAEKAGQFCGVVDYTKCLIHAFEKQNFDAETVVTNGYNLNNIWSFRRIIKNHKSAIIHLQYPSLGMGVFPFFTLLSFLFWRSNFYITLHEFSIFSLIRKLYMAPISLFAKKLIFTNQHEADRFCHYYPWAKKKCRIVPIGTNITASKSSESNRTGICYFGQITEGKGIEDFLDIVQILREQGNDIPCSIIGAMLDETLPVSQRLKQNSIKHDISVLLNKSNEEVSVLLGRHAVAILPFPDGVTDKRGSALACLVNGLELITVHSHLTPQWWMDVSHNFLDKEHAANLVLNIGDNQKENAHDVLQTALSQRQWPNIVTQHIEIYKEI